MASNSKIKKHIRLTAVWRNGGFSASYDSFVVGLSAVLRLNFCAKNPPLRQAAKRYRQGKSDHEHLCKVEKNSNFATMIFKNDKMTFNEQYINKIICGDSLTVMKQMPDECLDLVVTSPPYNLKNSTGNGMKACTTSGKWAGAALQNGYSHYDDNIPHDEYADWQHNCLKEMYRLLKNDGAIFYNHKWRVQNGLIQDRHDIIRDLPVRQIIIWRRKGGINFNPGYFLPTYEVIYLITKPDFKLVPKANAHGDVWEFTQEMKNDHPAPFPVALINRIISSTNAQIILDPFMGSGTTAVVAMGLKRNYIGIDLSPDYCEMAEKRIAKNKIQSELIGLRPLLLFQDDYNENIYQRTVNK